MKINTKIFKMLTRTPDIEQVVGVDEKVTEGGKKVTARIDRPFNIFFATPTELENYFTSDFFYIVASNGTEYKMLINREAYEFGINKDYFSTSMNTVRVHLLKKLKAIQLISLLGIMLPLMIIFLVTLSLFFSLRTRMKNPSNATYGIVGSLLLMLVTTYFVTRQTRLKMAFYSKKLDHKLESDLGVEKANEVYKSIHEYNKMMVQRREEQNKKAKEIKQNSRRK